MSTATDYVVKPVHKALLVLQCLGEGEKLSLSDICRQTHLPKTTVFRYLHTLEAESFVAHDSDTDLYQLGMRVFELGQAASKQMTLRDICPPFLRSLRDRFNETVNVGTLDGKEIVYLEIVESRRSLRMQARSGGRDPVYTTSLGKAMLAFLPEAEWPIHLPERLIERTSQSLTDYADLRRELLQT